MTITIGVFDGVHLGYKHPTAAVVSDARACSVKSLLIAFNPNPVALFAPDKVPSTLSTVSRRAELVEAERIDVMLVMPFDKTLSSIPAEDFARTAVRDRLNMQAVFVGQNFIYNQKVSGTTETLPKHGCKYRIDATIVDLLDVTAVDSIERVSLTRAHGLLADEAVSVTASCFGYFHRVDGDVIPGQGHGGAQLGFPITSIDSIEDLAIPAGGVHAAWFMAQPTAAHPEPDPKGDIEFGVRYSAAVSMGTNVTFGNTNRTVEAHVIDRHVDLHGTAGQVEFVNRTRRMEKFDSVEEPVDRMNQDVADTEAILVKANQLIK